MSSHSSQFDELDNDQRREMVNTRQRFDRFREVDRRLQGYKGSLTFVPRKGNDYLVRSYYDPNSGLRRQRSLGVRSEGTERALADFERGRAEAQELFAAARQALERQASVNRAIGLGRVPSIGARIVRAIDSAGFLGSGLRVVGTNSIFAYEAAAGMRASSEITTTEDIDLLFDARVSMRFEVQDDVSPNTLMGLLRRVDTSFERTPRTFQASNRDGYLVDLIRPMRDPPWKAERSSVGAVSEDLDAVQIEGLIWHENAPPFEAVAIDVQGFPVRICAPDPRAFAIHKLWLSSRSDRAPEKRARDAAQARAVARLVVDHMPHLPFEPDRLRSFPREVVEDATTLFEARPSSFAPKFEW